MGSERIKNPTRSARFWGHFTRCNYFLAFILVPTRAITEMVVACGAKIGVDATTLSPLWSRDDNSGAGTSRFDFHSALADERPSLEQYCADLANDFVRIHGRSDWDHPHERVEVLVHSAS